MREVNFVDFLVQDEESFELIDAILLYVDTKPLEVLTHLCLFPDDVAEREKMVREQLAEGVLLAFSVFHMRNFREYIQKIIELKKLSVLSFLDEIDI